MIDDLVTFEATNVAELESNFKNSVNDYIQTCEDLNVIFYQNMPNLHNLYKSAERKISQKSPEYIYVKHR
jgi:hypothetical protein